MNRIIWTIIIFFVLNGFLSLTGFLFPSIPMEKILPIQLWFNAILLLSLLLPTKVGGFLLNI